MHACLQVVVAHRLSTIKNADQIAVVREGGVAELGSHSQLIQKPDGKQLQQGEGGSAFMGGAEGGRVSKRGQGWGRRVKLMKSSFKAY